MNNGGSKKTQNVKNTQPSEILTNDTLNNNAKQTTQSTISPYTEMKYFLSEERNKNKSLLLHIKTVEENYKNLSEKYTELTQKHQELLSELSSLSKNNSDMKRNSSENKYKYEDLISLNCDLKNKLSSYENIIKGHNNDYKSLIKKNAALTTKINELQKENKTLKADIDYKEDRLNAVKVMNSKLEQRSNNLIKKWDTLNKIEQRSNEITKEANEAFETLKAVNSKLEQEITLNKALYQEIKNAKNENNKFIQEIQNAKEENKKLKQMNKQLLDKYQMIQNNFKMEIIEQARENKNKNTLVLSNNSRSSGIDSCENFYNESIPIEQTQILHTK